MLKFLFSAPRLWIFLIFAAQIIVYLIIMSPKINLHLGVFLGISIAFLAMFALILTFWVFTIWAILGILLALVYCAGVTVHLIKGNRHIKEILE
ncbi:MAG TPA: hypothetical protein GX745_03220 [Clostridiales bacterium]|nr:hypothetical protein [Clostridiales bacterium]